MSDSIRKQIIAAIETRLADILTANGYNTSIGASVFKATSKIDPDDDLPAVVLFPQPEDRNDDEYDTNKMTMPVRIEALMKHGSNNPSDVAENMLADIIECLTGEQWAMSFTSGGTYEIEAGDTITGDSSTTTAYVAGVSLDSGTFAGGDAAGTLTIRRLSGDFESENLDVGVNSNVATITGNVTYSSEITLSTGDLADRISYQSGGASDYPDSGELVTGVQALFNIEYYSKIGDPFSQ